MAKKKARAKRVSNSVEEAGKLFDQLVVAAEKDPSVLDEFTKPREGNPRTLGSRVPSAADMSEKQQRKASAAGADYLKGVLAPRKDPIAEAKKKVQKWANALQEAIRNGNFLKGLENIDEDLMYRIIEAGGQAAYEAGVTAKAEKYASKAVKLQPLLAAAAAAIDSMPDDTPEQRKARMNANLDNMRKIKGKV